MEMDPFVDGIIDEILEKDPMLSNASLNLPEQDDFFEDVDFDKEDQPPKAPGLDPRTIYRYETPPLVSPLPAPGLIENPQIMTPKVPAKRTRKASTQPPRRQKSADKPTMVKPSDDDTGEDGDNEMDTMLKSAVAKRAKSVKQSLDEVQANNGEVRYEPKTKYGWLFTIEKSLRYSLCDNCVKLYLKDDGKITEFENGYVMLNLMLCPSCVGANDAVKRAWKHGFGKKWEGGSWGGGGGSARGGWGGGGGSSAHGYYGAGGSRF